MSAKTEVTVAGLIKETVGQSLNINRSVMGLEPYYNINITYCNEEYLADEDGNKTRLLSSGINSKSLYLTQEKVISFYSKIISVDGVETTLGEYIASEMDSAIKYELENPPVTTLGGIPMMIPPV